MSAALAAASTARSLVARALRSETAAASTVASTAAADVDDDDEDDDDDDDDDDLPVEVAVDTAAVVERSSAGIGTPRPSNCDSATYWYCGNCDARLSGWCV